MKPNSIKTIYPKNAYYPLVGCYFCDFAYIMSNLLSGISRDIFQEKAALTQAVGVDY